MAVLKAQCKACGGTGIYRGFAEPEGVGVICQSCAGTGCVEIRYEPFTERRRRSGVHTVRRSSGTFIATGVGPTRGSVSYEEFLRGRMP